MSNESENLNPTGIKNQEDKSDSSDNLHTVLDNVHNGASNVSQDKVVSSFAASEMESKINDENINTGGGDTGEQTAETQSEISYTSNVSNWGKHGGPIDGGGDKLNGDISSNNVNEHGAKENEEAEYIDILGNRLLQKKVLVKGKGKDTRPLNGDVVTLNIEGYLTDGTAVDKYNSFSFYLGEGDVIQAWDLAVSLMEIGETCEVVTGAKYAYGEKGREPDIPVNSEITYTLELLKHEDKPDLDKISKQEKLHMGEKKRERGNFLFARQDYTGAINSYTKAVKILDHPGSNMNSEPSLLQEILDSKIKCCNNLAACQLKVEAYDAVIRSCQMVLISQPDNVKALFRLGKAYSAKGSTNEAISNFKKALKKEPESKIIHQELSKLTKKLKSETDSEKEMYRRMLGTNNSKNSNNKKPNSWWIKWTLLAGGLAVAGVSIILAVYRNH
ncbi:peptidyl-prolyl cis-trans isomerase FKBP8 [Patella vulgata]|uniref:peptidyl-prolyl cis-trans isomerase FKBP8 n=1 Tax=Patella vulgata TaxID=6465 RepID=UPI00217F5DE6|nr:peptidyl-prolyl cis-trans isomerase FKBP8 [Patella vulgata]XP_050402578.1 peptidyl-prolyl cis-trans isomerase FKBP8 [Patella vulgata]